MSGRRLPVWFALILALLLGAAGAAAAKPPVWIVRSHGTPR